MVLGVLGAMISIAAAVGYAVSYWASRPSRHLRCLLWAGGCIVVPAPSPASATDPSQPAAATPEASAWLVDQGTGHRHPLFVGDTRIGRRHSGNDIVLDHPSVSRVDGPYPERIAASSPFLIEALAAAPLSTIVACASQLFSIMATFITWARSADLRLLSGIGSQP